MLCDSIWQVMEIDQDYLRVKTAIGSRASYEHYEHTPPHLAPSAPRLGSRFRRSTLPPNFNSWIRLWCPVLH